MKTTYIFGHKNPDTDSVCSSIALSYLKNKLGYNTTPKVIGPINRETRFVLDTFKVDTPSYINDVKVQIKDINYVKKAYINENESIDNAFNFMKIHDLTAIPLVNNKNVLIGYVTLKDMAKYLINNERTYLDTNISLLLETLDAKPVYVDKELFNGTIKTITFSNASFIKEVALDENSILIVGDRYKVIEHAIKQRVKLIILAKNRTIPKKLLSRAKRYNINIISSSYESYQICNKISLCNYINTINSTPEPLSVNIDSYYTDFISLSKKHNYTNYPIVKKNNECVGLLRIIDTHKFERKNVILVDHNNYAQSVDGLEEANIVEIIDHHNLGSIGTSMPISFISKPLGCTATIIYGEYKKERVDIPKDISGLLLSAILSDTLLFTSPTVTYLDKEAAEDLAKIAKVDIKTYGMNMLKAASSIDGLSVTELINQDFKSYSINDKTYGIAVITTMDYDKIEANIDEYIDKLNEMALNTYEAVLIFITDIVRKGSYVLYNTEAESLISSSFNINASEGIFIKGLMSRKKQILPAIMGQLE